MRLNNRRDLAKMFMLKTKAGNALGLGEKLNTELVWAFTTKDKTRQFVNNALRYIPHLEILSYEEKSLQEAIVTIKNNNTYLYVDASINLCMDKDNNITFQIKEGVNSRLNS